MEDIVIHQVCVEREVDEESKAFSLKLSLSRREWKWEGEMTQFCFTECWCQTQRVHGGCGARDGSGLGLVHTGNAQCLVCFKWLRCWNWSLSFLLLSVVSCEMWKWFLVLEGSQILLGRVEFYRLYFPPSLSLLHHLPILHLMQFSDFVPSVGSLKLRSGVLRVYEVRW